MNRFRHEWEALVIDAKSHADAKIELAMHQQLLQNDQGR